MLTPEQIEENKRRFVEQRDAENAEKEPYRPRPAILVQRDGENGGWSFWEFK